jgi:hypothetical protein
VTGFYLLRKGRNHAETIDFADSEGAETMAKPLVSARGETIRNHAETGLKPW